MTRSPRPALKSALFTLCLITAAAIYQVGAGIAGISSPALKEPDVSFLPLLTGVTLLARRRR